MPSPALGAVFERAVNRQEQVDILHDEITDVTGLGNFGIYPTFPMTAWAQTD